MRYVLGADGGGSKIACVAMDGTGRLLGYGRGASVNTNYVAWWEAVESTVCAINTALKEAGLRGEQIEALCLSAPMAPDAVAEAARVCNIRHVVRAAEGQTPRWAVRFWTETRIGVTVDAGTGSMARGWARDGREGGSGGWGNTLGDEGSGYWISMKAMTAVLQAHDGRTAETRLTEAVLRHFGMANPLELVFRVSHGLVDGAGAEFGVGPDSGSEVSEEGDPSEGGVLIHRRGRKGPLARYEVATLCPVVVDLARQGDWKAVGILDDAGMELGRLAAAIIRRLGMEDEAFAVVPFGGVFRAGEYVLGSFRAVIEDVAPSARVIRPRFEPVVGAGLLALDEIGVVIDEGVISAVEQSADFCPACRAPGAE